MKIPSPKNFPKKTVVLTFLFIFFAAPAWAQMKMETYPPQKPSPGEVDSGARREKDLFEDIKPSKLITTINEEGQPTFKLVPKTSDELNREKITRIQQARGLSNDQKANLFIQEGIDFPANSFIGRHFSFRFKQFYVGKVQELLKRAGSGKGKVLPALERQQIEIEALNEAVDQFGRIPEDFTLPEGGRLKVIKIQKVIDLETGKLKGQEIIFEDRDYPGEIFTKSISGQTEMAVQGQ